MVLRALIAFFALSLLSSCVTVGKHAGFIGSAPEIEQEKMVVTVLYPRSYPMSAAFRVLQEDITVGDVKPGEYLVWETSLPEENRMLISAKGLDNDVAVLRPQGSRSQFLKISVTTDGFQPIMSLDPVSEEEALAFMDKANKSKDRKYKSSAVGR